MSESEQLVQFPVPSQTTLWLIAAGFAALLGVAIWIEFRRRTQLTRRRLASEWRSVREILDEHGLPKSERDLMRKLIKRHTPDHPLQAITTRRAFDACVSAEMDALHEAGDLPAYEREGALLRDIRTALGLDYVPLGQRIETTRNLYSGQMMQVALADNESAPWYRMMIELVDEAYFIVSYRGQDGAPPGFKKGDRVRCRIWRDEDARYTFTTSIAGREESPAGWRVAHTEDLHRTQNRSHFRVRLDQTTTIGLLNASKDGSEENLAQRRIVSKLRGRITSLSAGGCALVINQPIAKHVYLRIYLDFGAEGGEVDAEAKVVAATAISGGRYHVRATFIGLDEERRDQIAKYVLHRQQTLLAGKDESGKNA